MQKLLSTFSDGEGNMSMMRLVTFLMVATVLGEHISITIMTKQFQPWTPEQLGILGGALGAKLVQNNQEQTTPTK